MLHAAERPALCELAPSAELGDEGAAGGELRFVGGAPYCSLLAGWFRQRAISLGRRDQWVIITQ